MGVRLLRRENGNILWLGQLSEDCCEGCYLVFCVVCLADVDIFNYKECRATTRIVSSSIGTASNAGGERKGREHREQEMLCFTFFNGLAI